MNKTQLDKDTWKQVLSHLVSEMEIGRTVLEDSVRKFQNP